VSSPGRKRVGLLGALFIIAIGLVFVSAGVLLKRDRTPYADGVMTKGTVTGVEEWTDSKRRISYAPVITFTTTTGEKVTITDSEARDSRPKSGETVQISYRPKDPQSARVIPESDFASFGVMAMGGVTVLIGLGILVLRLIAPANGIALLSGAWRRGRNA
jgi:hypothetical protein